MGENIAAGFATSSAFSGAPSSVLSAAIGVDSGASGEEVACTAVCVAKTRATAAAVCMTWRATKNQPASGHSA